jgi:hypothetical protein
MKIRITHDPKYGSGYFVQYHDGYAWRVDAYCLTLWGAKRQAKKLMHKEAAKETVVWTNEPAEDRVAAFLHDAKYS